MQQLGKSTSPRIHPLARALGGGLCLVMAVNLASAATVTGAARQQTQQHFEIPAGSLGTALSEFASQAGITLSIEPALVEGKRSEALKADTNINNGLHQLLKGSGLEAVEARDGTFSLQKVREAGRLSTVKVMADAAAEEGRVFKKDRGTVLFGNSDLRETPFSVNVIGEDEMVRRRVRNLGDILETDPAATRTYFANGVTAVSNWGMVRGFHNNRGFVDGMPMLDNDLSQVEMLERVEILRGPASFRYGFIAPGGVISETTKRPTDEPFAALHASYDNWGMLNGHVDFSGHGGDENKLGYRVNIASNQGEGWAGDATTNRHLFGVTAEYDVSENTLVTLVLSNSSSLTDGISWGDPLFDVNGDQLPIGREADFGPAWVFEESSLSRGLVRIDNKLNDDLDLVVAFGTNRADWKYTNFWVDTDIGIQPNGDATWAGRAVPGEHNYTLGNTAYLNYRFKTGSVSHQLTVGYMLEKNSITWEMAGFEGGDWNVLERPAIPRPSAEVNYGYKINGDQYGVFVSDQLDIGEDWHAVVGARFTRITSKTIEHVTGGESPEDVTNGFTPMVGALYDLTDNLGVYASVGSGVEPGMRAPIDASNPGVQLGPRRSFQVETGLKWEVIPDAAIVDANLFHITQESQYYTGPGTKFQNQGEQRHIGGEILVNGRFWQPLWLSAGAQFIDTELLKAEDPAAEGSRSPGVPKISGVIDAELDITAIPGLYLTGTILRTGQIEHHTPNDNFDTDAWTRFDFGIGYTFNDWDISLRIENLTDKKYFVGAWGPSWAAPRTVSFGIDAEF